MSSKIVACNSSDSSDDESAKLLSAVDPDFKVAIDKVNGDDKQDSNPSPKKKLKTENQEQNIFRKHPLYSIDVTPDCQNFIAKRLFSALEKQIKEVNRNGSGVAQTSAKKGGIYLFSCSSSPLCEADLERSTPKKRKKPKIKRRKCEESDSDDEDARLKSVAVSSEWVLAKNF